MFCEVTEAAAVSFNRVFAEADVVAMTMVYVDDFLVLAESHLQLRFAFQLMDKEADLLGLSLSIRGRTLGLTCLCPKLNFWVC